MKPCLMLRLDAPLMSFGGVAIDKNGPTEMHPGASMITGLLANALGWRHREHARHEALQARIRVASRWDHAPEVILDYQTADLGQEHLDGTGWTTRGKPEGREGGSSEGTTIRYRQYLADGCGTVAVALEGPGEVSLEDLAHALQRPARPLVLGRRNCLPAAPILLGVRQAESLHEALQQEPLAERAALTMEQAGSTERIRLRAAWPLEEGPLEAGMQQEAVACVRQWKTAVHMGTRSYTFGYLEVKA
jgi:CRISPR system Cascade subunit CasD